MHVKQTDISKIETKQKSKLIAQVQQHKSQLYKLINKINLTKLRQYSGIKKFKTKNVKPVSSIGIMSSYDNISNIDSIDSSQNSQLFQSNIDSNIGSIISKFNSSVDEDENTAPSISGSNSSKTNMKSILSKQISYINSNLE